MNKEKKDRYVYDPMDKWWKFFLLWGAYNGEVKVYKYIEKNNEISSVWGKKIVGFAIPLGIVLGMSSTNALREKLNYEINMFNFVIESAIVSYLLMVLGIIIFEKIIFRKKRVQRDFDDFKTVSINLYKDGELKRIGPGIIILSLFYIGSTISIFNDQSLYGLVIYLAILLLLPSLIIFYMGNMLKIPERMKEGELEIIE
jgi:hypothetical protein